MLVFCVPASADMTKEQLANILVQHFSESYFRQGLDNGAASAYPIVKWPDEISIDIVNPELLPERGQEYANNVVAALRAAGFDIGLNATKSDRSNVSVILFDATDGFSKSDLDILKYRMAGNVDGLSYFTSRLDQQPTCFMGGSFDEPYHLKSAFAAINADMPAATIEHCLATVISGIVGFQGKVDGGVVSRSIFSSNDTFTAISDWDRLAFQMLADDRLAAGARYSDSTVELLRQMANELISTWPNPQGLEDQLGSH